MNLGDNMKTFKLYQIHLNKDEHNKVNAEGHNSVPKHKAHLDMMIGMKKDISGLAKDAWDKGYFTHVSNITAKDLGDVFHVGNVGPEEQIDRFAPMYSVSVGDIIEDKNGKKSVVASLGFQDVA